MSYNCCCSWNVGALQPQTFLSFKSISYPRYTSTHIAFHHYLELFPSFKSSEKSIFFLKKFCPHKKKNIFVLVSAHFLYAEGPQSYCFSEKQIFAGMSAPGIFYTGPKIFFVFTRCYLKMLEVINTESYLRNPSKWIFSNKSIESAARRSDEE